MKWSMYVAAVALIGLAAYRAAAQSNVTTDEVVYWLLSALTGGGVAIWIYDRWRMRGRWGPRPYD